LDIAVKEKLKDNELVYRVGLGEELIKQGKYQQANAALLAIQKDYEQTEDMESRANYYLMLAKSYNALGSFKNAVSCYTNYIKSRQFIDSVNNISLGENFEYTIKSRMASIRDSIRSVRQRHNDRITMVKQQETIKRSNERIIYGIIILIIFLIALVFAYRAFRIKSKVARQLKLQRDEIQLQKNIIQQKNAEVTDSINYARQLQQAILPSKNLFAKYFSEFSLFYKPKDIVAGDFYFLEELQNQDTTHVIFGVADCTGHGVPGAMVSVVCSNALHRAVNEFKLSDPGKILDKVRELVLGTFEKSGGDVKDGMDISLCSMEFLISNSELSPNSKFPIRNSLLWAGANNPLWVINNGIIKEIKADKQPIGKFVNPTPFTTHTIPVNVGDVLVLFSDGYADQFGGPKVKKLKYSNFQKIVLENVNPPVLSKLEVSNLKIQTVFTQWMGANEQTDDVCVLALKV
jgi:serine phosphatase RsbU (regulator of sigma subunit)